MLKQDVTTLGSLALSLSQDTLRFPSILLNPERYSEAFRSEKFHSLTAIRSLHVNRGQPRKYIKPAVQKCCIVLYQSLAEFPDAAARMYLFATVSPRERA